ncbi:Heme-binding protein 2 [Sesamum alatum]|uniref:Heme-binding protein 2 n=1 Tax=Sesamum alatum TaxID=300844 RepID=A0AAE1YN11_9LAMI|nr:Heme-binding protein 2 [Sesamum alatum]
MMMSSPRTAVCVFVFLCLFVSECKGADEGYPPAETCSRLECPPYKVIQTQKEFEIRSYDQALWLASPKIPAATYKEGASKGFRILFSYYRGNNTERVTINMTALVLIDVLNSTYTVHFYVPKKYQTGTSLPTPLPTDQITKVTLPKFKYVAVRRFDGLINDGTIAPAIAALRQSLQGTPYQQAAAAAQFTVAGYNSPRRLTNRVNEVWLGFN